MTMPSNRSGGCGIDDDRCVSSDSVRKPCAIGTPHGDISLHAAGSTWMNWWSCVTSANVLMRSWVTSNHSPVPSFSPIAALNSSYAVSPLLMAVTVPTVGGSTSGSRPADAVGHGGGRRDDVGQVAAERRRASHREEAAHGGVGADGRQP